MAKLTGMRTELFRRRHNKLLRRRRGSWAEGRVAASRPQQLSAGQSKPSAGQRQPPHKNDLTLGRKWAKLCA